jgi:rSAM/selenodomain-associated transferase 1
MRRATLVIFVKAPVIGGAKTRLATGIGKVSAWRLHRAMSAKTIRKTRSNRWDTILAVSPDNAVRRRFPGTWPKGIRKLAQGAGDLGVRQTRLFNRFNGPVCVIGSDAPQVCASDIAKGFNALRHNQAVIGPAEDGGYWLLGLHSPGPNTLFQSIRWSHASTRKDLERNLSRVGLKPIAYLRRLQDIDHKADLRAISGRAT